jgi:hypothetical protein
MPMLLAAAAAQAAQADVERVWRWAGSEVPGARRQPSTLSEADLATAARRVHQLLFTVTRLIPTSLTALLPVLREHYPHPRSAVLAPAHTVVAGVRDQPWAWAGCLHASI